MASVVGELKYWLRSCWEFMMCSHGGAGAPAGLPAEEFDDPLLWSHDLGRHSAGEFSFATLRAHNDVEDQSQVETGNGAIFVGVYDGHHNDMASKFVCDNLFLKFNALAQQAHAINEEVLKSAFAQTESAFLDRVAAEHIANPEIKGAGTCCLVIKGRTLYVANAGDSRVVLGRRNGLCRIEAKPLTRDDNARLQEVRTEVWAADAFAEIIEVDRVWRIKGLIQVTRAIGNAFLKLPGYGFERGHRLHFEPPLTRPALSAVPRVLRRELTSRDRFLIFASDGLWDLLGNDVAVEIVHKNPRHGIAKRLIKQAIRMAGHLHKIDCETIVSLPASDRRRIHDDISVVVVFIDGQQNPAPESVQIRGNENNVPRGRFDLEGVQ